MTAVTGLLNYFLYFVFDVLLNSYLYVHLNDN